MNAELVVFLLFALVAVVSAIATVLFKNPIRSAMGLFVHVSSLAGLYMLLSAHFLVAVQLIVYVGAVVVLFVFVIMLLGPDSEAPRDSTAVLSRAVGGAALTVVGALVAVQLKGIMQPRITRPPAFGTVREVAGYLFGQAVLPFELASVLLIAAVVGAFAVARGHHQKVKLTSGPNEPSLESAKTPTGEPE